MNKRYSLKKSYYFNEIINNGIKIRSNYFLISFIESNDFKIGISIPKKLGNAVFRNYNKRIIKNIIPKIDIFNKKKHIVLIVKKNFIDLNFEKKCNILKNELNKIRD